MEDIVAFVSDDENLTTVVAGVAVVGATIVGGLYASTRETAAQKADPTLNNSQVRQHFILPFAPRTMRHAANSPLLSARLTRHTARSCTYALLQPRGAVGM